MDKKLEVPHEEKPADDNKGAASALVDKIQALGQTNVPQLPKDSTIHCLTIIGQIEGHVQLPPQNKTTKYEHVIPQLVAIEQNPDIKGLITFNRYGIFTFKHLGERNGKLIFYIR